MSFRFLFHNFVLDHAAIDLLIFFLPLLHDTLHIRFGGYGLPEDFFQPLEHGFPIGKVFAIILIFESIYLDEEFAGNISCYTPNNAGGTYSYDPQIKESITTSGKGIRIVKGLNEEKQWFYRVSKQQKIHQKYINIR
ncbi:hypothetical protein AAH145_05485 [Bacteroides thetaiotaomicron]|uniref:hypothetical protein n=1 Tax=Bacteroides thetaiotaomicron TaxID=818 RepID=UPI0039B3B91A